MNAFIVVCLLKGLLVWVVRRWSSATLKVGWLVSSWECSESCWVCLGVNVSVLVAWNCLSSSWLIVMVICLVVRWFV